MPASDHEFAAEIGRLAAQGDFDPFTLIAGEPVLHHAFLAPLTPGLQEGIRRFLGDGTGPMAGVVEHLRAQGAADPAGEARTILAGAQGVCVAVFAGDHGVSAVPSLFHGDLGEGYAAHLAGACGKRLRDPAPLGAALAELRRQAEGGTRWPGLVAGPQRGADPAAHWLALGRAVVATLAGSPFGGASERLADLAWWCQDALALLLPGRSLAAAEALGLVRLQLAAGAVEAAGGGMLALIEAGAAGEEQAAELLAAFADAALRAGREAEAADWLQGRLEALERALGGSYEAAQALFRLRAAAAAPAEALLEAAARLAGANRKAMRQDLAREPIWAVRPARAGELLEPAQAAQLCGLTAQQVAKRLEKGTIPSTLHEGRLRIPKGPLLAWKAVMEAHRLLEG